jgi:tRNA (guanine37-N1)-methyltransferase
VRSLCVKVPKGKGEAVRKELLQQGWLDISLKVRREGGHIMFPVLDERASALGHPVCEEDFEDRPLAETDYKRLVDLPDGLREMLPTSFDVIGDVGIIKLPDELLPYSKEVGEGLRKAFPRLRSVALDQGVKGELRVRDLQVIAGEEDTETTHLEYGIKLLVDPAKTYFNPRLANERMRVASLVKDQERVIDMFAGVGPFSIMIAKRAHPQMVFAIDLNHDAVEYLKRNLELNKVHKVQPIEGDAREVLFELPHADRIIMNLPHSAVEFFHDALSRLNMGGTIHLYHICEREEIDQVLEGLCRESCGAGVKVEVVRLEELKSYSPSLSVFSADLLLADWA